DCERHPYRCEQNLDGCHAGRRASVSADAGEIFAQVAPMQGEKMASRNIDPELLRQLNAVAADNEPVEAVVRLNPDNPAEIVPSPERTEELARKVLQRVAKRVGNPVMKHNVFSNLGSFVVSAPTQFVRELIEQPEVAAAVANRQAGEALIPPINKKPLVEKPQ